MLLDLNIRGFELRGVSKVHLAAYREALLYIVLFQDKPHYYVVLGNLWQYEVKIPVFYSSKIRVMVHFCSYLGVQKLIFDHENVRFGA